MTKIEKLEDEIFKLEKKILPIQEKIRKKREEIFALQSKFKVGDTITWGSNKMRGTVFRITRWIDEPAWMVNVIRKDGSQGSVMKIRSYDNPEKV